MYPVLAEYTLLFGWHRPVAGYGLMFALGVLVAMATAALLADRRGLSPLNVTVLTMVCVLAGLVGSYVLFLVTMMPEILRDPKIALAGGLVFYGGPLAAIPAGWWFCRHFELPPLRVADLAAPAVAVGHAWGRLGCFLGGCCFGKPWEGPWAVVFIHPLAPAAHPSVARHPVQLYEALFLLVSALSAHLLWRHSTRNGQAACGYVIAYGLWRLGIETLRADEIRGTVCWGMLSTSQLISLALVPLAVVGLRLLPSSRST